MPEVLAGKIFVERPSELFLAALANPRSLPLAVFSISIIQLLLNS